MVVGRGRSRLGERVDVEGKPEGREVEEGEGKDVEYG